MNNVKIIIGFCYNLLNISINLFGYNISLLNVLIWGGLVCVVVWLFYGIMK